MSRLSDWNEVRVSGRLTHNPELRKTDSGVAVCDISVASNRYARPDANGNQREFTTFVRATAWNKQAEYIAKNAHTGDEVILLGILEDDNFKPEGGDKTYGRLKVRIDDFRLVGRRPSTKVKTEVAPTAELSAD